MGRLRAGVLVSVVLTLAAGVGWELGRSLRGRHRAPAPPQAATCPLSVPPGELRIGQVWETDRLEWPLDITNDGDGPVDIQSFRVSCGCVKVTPPALSLLQGQTRQVTLTLDLTSGANKVPPDERRSARRWGVRIEPALAQGAALKVPSWVLEALVRPVLDRDAEYIECGAHSVLDQRGCRGRLRVKALAPIAAIDVVCGSPLLRASVERDVKDSSLFHIEVAPNAALPVGRLESEILLVARRIGEGSLPGQRIPVGGRVVPDVQVFPEAILLGAQPVDARVVQVVALGSLTGVPMRVKGVVAPEGAEVEPIKTRGGPPGLHYRVTQRIARAGPQTSQVRFILASPNGEEGQEAVVDVLWHGVPGRGGPSP
jgi:hypothetical protein